MQRFFLFCRSTDFLDSQRHIETFSGTCQKKLTGIAMFFLFFVLMAFPSVSLGYETTGKPPRPAVEKRVVPPADSAFENWLRIPYIEKAPKIDPTAEEKMFGGILFTRPLVDAIYPETVPLPQERVKKIVGAGAWNQFETLNFALYPLTPLKNIRVTVSDLTCGKNRIPAANITVRLVTYRDITYPLYASKGAWRRLPEYLQEVTTCDAPQGEPQRFCLTVRPSKGLPGGIYSGNILVSHDEFDRALVLPIKFEILPFEPKRDPNKNFSAYYYPADRHELVRSGKKDKKWAEDALEKEFKTMTDYGFTRMPTISLSCDIDKKTGKANFYIPKIDQYLDLMKKNGMSEPMLIIGGGVTWLYEKATGGKVGNHIVLDKLPPQSFYDQIAQMAADFKKECTEKHYPKMVFGPLDEISGNPTSIAFGVGIYRAFQKGGLTTYTTMEVENPGFKKIDPYIDIFGTQAFLPEFDETLKKVKKGYWCYPNHNSYERKDPVIMCKGGRMTYGFGYWRSGFDLLVPWIWRNNNPKHFYEDRGSGGANIFHPETGDMIMTVTWENFREGINDLNYIYTLQDAIVKRADSSDPKVQKLTNEGKDLLRTIWNSIAVQEKYLNVELWPSDLFDARRMQIARLILELQKTPETNNQTAPSVLPEIYDKKYSKALADDEQPTYRTFAPLPEEIYQNELKNNNIVKTPLFTDKAKNRGWNKTEEEAAVSLETVPGSNSPQVVCLTLKIDTINDGTGNKSGSYPAGWPGMVYSFSDKKIYTEYDLVRIRYRLDSDRAEKNNPTVNGPFSYLIRVQGADKKSTSIALKMPNTLPEGKWIECIGFLYGQTYDGINTQSAALDHIRASIAESRYEHGDTLRFYFDEMDFITLKKPIFAKLEVPSVIQIEPRRIQFSATVLGKIETGSSIAVDILDSANKVIPSIKRWTARIPSEKSVRGQLNLPETMTVGQYIAKFSILNKEGSVLNEKLIPLKFIR